MDALSLRTERLVMLALTAADVDEIAALYADPEVMRNIAGGARSRPETIARLEAYEQSWTTNGVGVWAIRDAETGGLLGEGGIHPAPQFGEDAIDFAITIGRRSWGSGVDFEAGEAIIDDTWQRHPGDLIHAMVLPDDVAGSSLLSRLKFALTGVRESHGQAHQVWAITRHG